MPIATATIPDSLIGASKAPRLAVFALQPVRAAKHPAEIADVLTEHDHALVLGHLAIHRVADRLDHRHARHGLNSELLALLAEVARHLL